MYYCHKISLEEIYEFMGTSTAIVTRDRIKFYHRDTIWILVPHESRWCWCWKRHGLG